MIENQDSTSISNDTGIVIFPVTFHKSGSEEDYLSSSQSGSGKKSNKKSGKNPNKTDVHIFSVESSSHETTEAILNQVNVDDVEAVRKVAACANMWKSIGAETLIYMSSYGGTLISNGLIIRFTGFNVLASSLLMGSVGAVLSPHMYLTITSLLKPPKDIVPDDKKGCQELLNKYAFLPVSWLISAGLSGATLTVLRDPSFGTQQIVSAISATFVGPIIHGLKVGTRKCLGGTVDEDPEYPTIVEALTKSYSTDPNPYDNDRPFRWDTVINSVQRAITISAGTLVLFYNSGFNVETYCIGGGDTLRNLTSQGNYTITGQDVEQNCWGGGVTYGFRELGISGTYALGMMVVEPIMRWGMNKLFDYFYQPQQEDSSDVKIIEMNEDSNDSV